MPVLLGYPRGTASGPISLTTTPGPGSRRPPPPPGRAARADCPGAAALVVFCPWNAGNVVATERFGPAPLLRAGEQRSAARPARGVGSGLGEHSKVSLRREAGGPQEKPSPLPTADRGPSKRTSVHRCPLARITSCVASPSLYRPFTCAFLVKPVRWTTPTTAAGGKVFLARP